MTSMSSNGATSRNVAPPVMSAVVRAKADDVAMLCQAIVMRVLY
jgi:hypothetical protein